MNGKVYINLNVNLFLETFTPIVIRWPSDDAVEMAVTDVCIELRNVID